MLLIKGHDAVAGAAEMVCNAPAIFQHQRCVVPGAETAIKAGVDALRNAALTGEEAVPNPRHVRQVRGFER